AVFTCQYCCISAVIEAGLVIRVETPVHQEKATAYFTGRARHLNTSGTRFPKGTPRTTHHTRYQVPKRDAPYQALRCARHAHNQFHESSDLMQLVAKRYGVPFGTPRARDHLCSLQPAYA